MKRKVKTTGKVTSSLFYQKRKTSLLVFYKVNLLEAGKVKVSSWWLGLHFPTSYNQSRMGKEKRKDHQWLLSPTSLHLLKNKHRCELMGLHVKTVAQAKSMVTLSFLQGKTKLPGEGNSEKGTQLYKIPIKITVIKI